ncbi:MAG: TonB-dependent receptor, partial [Aquisalinus sp.]|nr:TonB-dependent receptor [Aquisalinus sp.]
SNLFTGTAFILDNAEEQNAKGLEIDTMWYPTENWTVTFSGTFLDPEFTEFTQGSVFNSQFQAVQTDLSGTQPGNIAETTLSTAATWTWERGNYNGFVRGDWQYIDEITIQGGGDRNFNNTALGAVGFDTRAVSTINGSVGITRDNIDVLFWGRNLFNDEYITTTFNTTAQQGSLNGYPNMPRTYGVNVRAKF